jgi:hypothetical protein
MSFNSYEKSAITYIAKKVRNNNEFCIYKKENQIVACLFGEMYTIDDNNQLFPISNISSPSAQINNLTTECENLKRQNTELILKIQQYENENTKKTPKGITIIHYI